MADYATPLTHEPPKTKGVGINLTPLPLPPSTPASTPVSSAHLSLLNASASVVSARKHFKIAEDCDRSLNTTTNPGSMIVNTPDGPSVSYADWKASCKASTSKKRKLNSEELNSNGEPNNDSSLNDSGSTDTDDNVNTLPPPLITYGGIKNLNLVRPYQLSDKTLHPSESASKANQPLVFQHGYGTYPHTNLLNPSLKYGDRLQSACTDSDIRILKVSVENLMSVENRGGGDNTASEDSFLSTSVRRTQIVDITDSSFITSVCLNLIPGQTLIESGTGSGMFTLQGIRAVNARPVPSLSNLPGDQDRDQSYKKNHGSVYSYEFNRERCLAARRDLKNLSLDKGDVVCTWSDVCGATLKSSLDESKKHEISHGFPHPHRTKEENEQIVPLPPFADAIFLDLPEPWIAILGHQVDNSWECTPHTSAVLRSLKVGSGRLCTYSPCIEQTHRCVKAMMTKIKSKDGRMGAPFHSIRTLEVRKREFLPHIERFPREGVGGEDISCAIPSFYHTGGHLAMAEKREKEKKEKEDNKGGEEEELGYEEVLTARVYGTQKGHTAFLTYATRSNFEYW